MSARPPATFSAFVLLAALAFVWIALAGAGCGAMAKAQPGQGMPCCTDEGAAALPGCCVACLAATPLSVPQATALHVAADVARPQALVNSDGILVAPEVPPPRSRPARMT